MPVELHGTIILCIRFEFGKIAIMCPKGAVYPKTQGKRRNLKNSHGHNFGTMTKVEELTHESDRGYATENYGGGGRNRTDTGLPPPDFESGASRENRDTSHL